MKRQFCTVYLWSSENYSPELIRERTREACFRTNYVAKYGQPVTLRDHVEQEKFVAKQNGNKTHLSSEDREKLQKIFDLQAESDDYNVIFHFFYGDEACKSLGFPFTASGTDAQGFDFCAG